MSYLPLTAIVGLLAIGAAVTLTVLFRSAQAGYFSNLDAEAYLIFDDEEPLGEVQDQVFHSSESASPDST